jgi:hypothetical protein
MASTGDMPATTAAGIDDRSASPVIPQTRWTKFVSLVWDSDYYLKSPTERRLVFKLDCMILSVVCELTSRSDRSSLTCRFGLVHEGPYRVLISTHTHAETCSTLTKPTWPMPTYPV